MIVGIKKLLWYVEYNTRKLSYTYWSVLWVSRVNINNIIAMTSLLNREIMFV